MVPIFRHITNYALWDDEILYHTWCMVCLAERCWENDAGKILLFKLGQQKLATVAEGRGGGACCNNQKFSLQKAQRRCLRKMPC
jgi:hypothetical protein